MKVPPYIGWPLLIAFSYGVLYFWANRMIYYPFKYPDGFWDLQPHLGAKDVWLTTADGVKLHGWFVEAPAARVVTLFLHGNAGNVTHRGAHMRAIAQAGSSVLVIDYRGYGRSQGSPSEKGLYADADAGYEYVARLGKRVVIHGESLGSAVAVDLASRKPCAGLVLEAPFSSARAVAARVLPLVGPLLIWSYDAKSKIRSVKAPLLVIHGDRDEVIDYSLGRDLFEAANQPKEHRRVEGGHHNDILESAGPAYVEWLSAFYARQ